MHVQCAIMNMWQLQTMAQSRAIFIFIITFLIQIPFLSQKKPD